MYMEIPARKKSSASTTVPDIYRVSFLVVAVASAPLLLKPLFPSLQHFVAATIQWGRDSFSRWLTPPYLFFLLNCIILAIIANSNGLQRLKFNSAPKNDEPQEPDYHPHFLQGKEISIQRQKSAPEEKEIIQNDCEEAKVIDSEPATQLLAVEKRTNSLEAAAWKPAAVAGIASHGDDQANKMLASARFTRRKASVHDSACKSLRVTQNHKEETFESVWKNITEGRHPPLMRHLRSTPCNNPDELKNDHSSPSARRHVEEESSAAPPPPPRGGRGTGSLQRETSVGVDDLNKRVEAFIEKFNADMRLQKEHSLLHYMEMINRGA